MTAEVLRRSEFTSPFALEEVALEVGHGFLDCRSHRLTAPLYFPHEHGALYSGDAKVSQILLAGLRSAYPEIHLQTLEEWLRSEGWHKRAKRMRAPKE